MNIAIVSMDRALSAELARVLAEAMEADVLVLDDETLEAAIEQAKQAHRSKTLTFTSTGVMGVILDSNLPVDVMTEAVLAAPAPLITVFIPTDPVELYKKEGKQGSIKDYHRRAFKYKLWAETGESVLQVFTMDPVAEALSVEDMVRIMQELIKRDEWRVKALKGFPE